MGTQYAEDLCFPILKNNYLPLMSGSVLKGKTYNKKLYHSLCNAVNRPEKNRKSLKY